MLHIKYILQFKGFKFNRGKLEYPLVQINQYVMLLFLELQDFFIWTLFFMEKVEKIIKVCIGT